MNRKSVNPCSLLFIIVLLLFCSSFAWAEYPERPVKVIIGWPGGSGSDIPTRALCQGAQKILKQPFVVENIVGASGTKGLAILSNSAPDGYTLGHVNTTGISEKPYIMKVSYDPLKGFTPIMMYGLWGYGAVVRKDSPWKTFKEFVQFGIANPRKIKYGTPGHGSTQHMFVERLQLAVPGLKLTHIPFQSESMVITALLGGDIQVGFMSSMFLPFAQAGEVRLLAPFHRKRYKAFPDVPTVEELGYPAAAEAGTAIIAPAGLQPPLRKKLQDTFKQAMNDPDFTETLEKFEIEKEYMSGEELEAFLRKKYEETARVVKELPK